METPEALASAWLLGGLLFAQMFHVVADRRWVVLLFAPASLLGAVVLHRAFPGAQADAEWVAASVALATAAVLAEGRYARVFSMAAGMALVPAVRASASLLEVALSSVPASLATVAAALVAGCVAGWASRSLRDRPVFSDLALLALLCSVALMAGPTAILGWQRASIAAEGDETSYASPSLWVLAPIGVAFLAGFAWRLWRINRTVEGRGT
jgi:hypothetical protein